MHVVSRRTGEHEIGEREQRSYAEWSFYFLRRNILQKGALVGALPQPMTESSLHEDNITIPLVPYVNAVRCNRYR